MTAFVNHTSSTAAAAPTSVVTSHQQDFVATRPLMANCTGKGGKENEH